MLLAAPPMLMMPPIRTVTTVLGFNSFSSCGTGLNVCVRIRVVVTPCTFVVTVEVSVPLTGSVEVITVVEDTELVVLVVMMAVVVCVVAPEVEEVVEVEVELDALELVDVELAVVEVVVIWFGGTTWNVTLGLFWLLAISIAHVVYVVAGCVGAKPTQILHAPVVSVGGLLMICGFPFPCCKYTYTLLLGVKPCPVNCACDPCATTVGDTFIVNPITPE